MIRSLVAVTAVCSFGCSFVLVSGPPSEPTERTPDAASRCTSSVLHPVLDTVGAGIGALNIGIAADASPGKVSWYGVEMDADTGMGLGIAQLGVYGAAAVYGYIQTARCRSLRDELERAPDEPTWSPATRNQHSPEPAMPPGESTGSVPTPTAVPAPTATAAPAPTATPVPAPTATAAPTPASAPAQPRPASTTPAPASSAGSSPSSKSFPDP
jgi:hypothetical protein